MVPIVIEVRGMVPTHRVASVIKINQIEERPVIILDQGCNMRPDLGNGVGPIHGYNAYDLVRW